jgi:peptidoglycan/xylan/chitin deacetylase (PgdA/CDA1 family)
MSSRSFLVITLSLLAGCSLLKPKTTPSPAPTPTPPAPPKIDYAALKPNELGRIPIIMYYTVGGKEGKDTKMNRTVASFNRDLTLLYKNNYVPVNLNEILEDKIDIPAGKKPVVLTFDDARDTQFKLIEQKDSMQIDPNCAVGLIEAFCKTHPEWKPRGVFYALPKSGWKKDAFDQEGLGDQKLQYLVKNGYEIGNHSVQHASFAGYSAQKIDEEVGKAHQLLLQGAPNAKVTSLALPFGVYPRDKKLWPNLIKGKSYTYKAALLAGWEPTPPPAAKNFDRLRMTRITPEDIVNGLANWIKRLERVSPYAPYVSDGDPNCLSYPVAEKAKLNPAYAKLSGKLVNQYDPANPPAAPGVPAATPAPAKPIVGGG